MRDLSDQEKAEKRKAYLERMRAQSAATREKRFAAGKCVVCALRPWRAGKRTCEQCASVLRKREEAYKAQAHRCTLCERPGHNRNSCPKGKTGKRGPKECIRCFAMARPGHELCDDHERTMYEIYGDNWREHQDGW